MSPRSRRIIIVLILLLLALLALFVFERRSKSKIPAPAKAAVTSPPPVPAVARAPAPAAPPAEEVLAPATVRIPAQVEAGKTFRAEWTGPNNAGDYLTIVKPDASATRYENYQETRFGAELDLVAPIEPGEWEVRYVAVRSKTILGRAPLVVNPISATLVAADEVILGTAVSITWTGPNNAADYICIVATNASDAEVGNYTDTAKGSPLTVEAPVVSGEMEIRYVSGQGRKVLARRKLMVATPETTLAASAVVTAGTKFSVTWQGPKNPADYITVVLKGTPDGQYRNYTDTAHGSPLELTAPIEPGEAEIRYMTGRNARVLARRALTIVAAPVTLDAAAEAIAGAPVSIGWSGPKNPGDYLTIVPKTTPDGQYGNYTDADKGSPLKITAPIRAGQAEIRYMSGQGAKVLARRGIMIATSPITLKVPEQGTAGGVVSVEWSGPNHAGDYFTLVPKAAKDGTVFKTTYTAKGSPARVEAPKEPGACEVRYMSGQGNVVLARAEIGIR